MHQMRSAADEQRAIAAFPSWLTDEVRTAVAVIPAARYAWVAAFSVDVSGESVAIPYRIYNDEPPAGELRSLTTTQRLILHCLYSRHGNGYVRQRHIEQAIGSPEPWVVPFVLQLAGEYVLEILAAIRHRLPDLAAASSETRFRYADFVAHNQAFFERTERRVVSYWACYYRHRYPDFNTYPGSLLLQQLRTAASERTGRPWPCNTPRPPAEHI